MRAQRQLCGRGTVTGRALVVVAVESLKLTRYSSQTMQVIMLNWPELVNPAPYVYTKRNIDE